MLLLPVSVGETVRSLFAILFGDVSGDILLSVDESITLALLLRLKGELEGDVEVTLFCPCCAGTEGASG